MAESPAHRLGQILGEVLEVGVEDLLKSYAEAHNLYLDKKGERPCRTGAKVTWKDRFGNSHDLDYVLERGGSHTQIGVPVAFIESAWRSYTKHSRAKAQEIQGAVLPIIDTHKLVAPFQGVVLAGMFTTGALTQLQSLGFEVLFFPVKAVVDAFASVKVDVSFGEDTSTAELAGKVKALEGLTASQRRAVAATLFNENKTKVQGFVKALEASINRQVASVRILPLHGEGVERTTVSEAIAFVTGYDGKGGGTLQRFEVTVKFDSGSRIEGQFVDKQSALAFLETFQVPLKPVAEEPKKKD